MAEVPTESPRPLKGWWTLGAGVGVAALGALQTWLQAGGGGLIPIPYVGPALIGVGFLIAYLRSITDTEIGKKQ